MGIEQIVGAEMVTAKGDVVSFGEEDERLEGLRGMGGNLGVITAVTIKVYPKIDVSFSHDRRRNKCSVTTRY
jgi:FAD/FMN-containing dehydrogenase